ncbi:MAG: type IV pilus secretin PilQ [Myxococcales bacterium]
MVAGLACPAAASASASVAPDRVREIETRPTPNGGVVVLHGTRAPVFSVFRLSSPDRIVVDLAGADVSAASAPKKTGVPGLSAVSAVQFQRGDSRVGRVILEAAASVRYDVRVEGNDVLVALDTGAEKGAPGEPAQRTRPGASAIAEPVRAAAPLAAAADPHVVDRAEHRAPVVHPGHRVLSAAATSRAGRQHLEIRTDGAVSAYTVWRLKDPPRVAVDLEGFRAAHARARKDGGVASIRFGGDAKSARVVFDLEDRSGLAGGDPPEVEVAAAPAGLSLALGEAPRPAVATAAAAPKASVSRPVPHRSGEHPVQAVHPGATRVERAVASRPVPPALRDLRVSGDSAGERIVVEIPGDALASLPQVEAEGPGRFQLSLDGIAVPARLQRTLDASAFGGPISTVSSFNLGTGFGRVVVTASASSRQQLERQGRQIVWTFLPGPPTAAAQAAEATGASQTVEVKTQESSGAAAGFTTAAAEAGAASPQRPRYTGRRISMEFKDIDIQNLLRLFAEISHKNIVVSDDVKGKVTIALRNVPWDQAFDLILRTHGLGKEEVGNIVRIAPEGTLEKERKEALDAMHAREQLEPLKVRLIPVNYALAGDVADKIKDVLSDRGVVTVDQRTNVLIVKDMVENLAKAEGMVRNLDTQTPEVLIESRIVEAATNFAREIGIQWGGNASFSPATANPTGLVFPSTATMTGAGGQGPNDGTAAIPNFAVNLPAAIGPGSGGGLGFIFGSAGGAFNLNLRLSALENNGLVKTVSAPKVATLDNQEAAISQGLSIPFSQVSAAGVQTTFIEARLELKVTPHVTADGSILMKISATNNQPNSGITGANGQPSISRKEAKTQMLVKDGDTTVIGGIYTRQTGVAVNEVPFFGNIPILGWLFKHRADSDNRTELLIFITPRILNRQQVVSAGAGG